jgi:hypothetical protein
VSNAGPNKIIVFDIDDTVLANYPEMLDSDFGTLDFVTGAQRLTCV